MNRNIVGRHFDLTEGIKNYVNSAIDTLDKYNLNIISETTIISSHQKHGKKGYSVEFVINLKDKNTIVITQSAPDIYESIDLAIERVKKSLRRHADKIKGHRINSFKDMGEDARAVLNFENVVYSRENASKLPAVVPKITWLFV